MQPINRPLRRTRPHLEYNNRRAGPPLPQNHFIHRTPFPVRSISHNPISSLIPGLETNAPRHTIREKDIEYQLDAFSTEGFGPPKETLTLTNFDDLPVVDDSKNEWKVSEE